jgi:hypothetical protein
MFAGSKGRDTALPWGWWLRVVGSSIEDSQGRRWNSVRQAFWEGELGFPPTHVVPEQLELLLRVLTAIDRHWVTADESKHDLFGGDMLFWRFYQCWLSSVGLLGPDPRVDPLSAALSDEGRSVLLMLQATREPAWIPLPFAAVIDAVRGADRTAADDQRERALRAFEQGVTRLPHLFARESVHTRQLVTLTGLDTVARMPMRKVVWSLSFPEARARDDFFAWLAERVDRWEDWGKIAYSKGADALTQHLLGLLATKLTAS